jgi:hypothetical protein
MRSTSLPARTPRPRDKLEDQFVAGKVMGLPVGAAAPSSGVTVARPGVQPEPGSPGLTVLQMPLLPWRRG